ncbi:ankyrin repeat domain-containing protein [Oceanobacter mangrovi]|uniref:ankyrin repeat domain-containing protein n=1 Tax=Oceanobacter mangrovi TaxID=2862510 RepID=UPI001C8E4E35|nr:ankyrin repeat domain-containing protein [Oceanobacter mangrovi]
MDTATAATALSDATRQWMIEWGFNPDQPAATGQYQDTPLIRAARNGDATITLELLALGPQACALNHRNMDGTNALWAAVVANSLDVAEQLLAAGIDIDNLNDNGASVLMYASSSGKAPWVQYLLEAGADSSAETLDGFTALDLAANIHCLKLLKAAR